jgi:hypothetical protein
MRRASNLRPILMVTTYNKDGQGQGIARNGQCHEFCCYSFGADLLDSTLKEPILRRNRIACLSSHGCCRSVSQPGDTMLSPKSMDWKSSQCSYHQNKVTCAQKPKGRLYPNKGSPQPVMQQPKRYAFEVASRAHGKSHHRETQVLAIGAMGWPGHADVLINGSQKAVLLVQHWTRLSTESVEQSSTEVSTQ